jgi:hypothetical protein
MEFSELVFSTQVAIVKDRVVERFIAMKPQAVHDTPTGYLCFAGLINQIIKLHAPQLIKPNGWISPADSQNQPSELMSRTSVVVCGLCDRAQKLEVV